jgi:glycosyltransferase involved in cell wall biosynthesis
MANWKERCTIGITTRDRSNDLAHTIERLKAIGLGDLRYMIVDDGSANAEAFRSIAAQLPRSRFVRHEQSTGYIQRRNEMAELCETEFLISLDDDSYFNNLEGMDKVFATFDTDSKLGLASFKIIELRRHETPICRRTTQLPAGYFYWFRGCGYAVRVRDFLAVGGFPAEFRYGSEESHLLHQFFRLGMRVLHAPDVVVEHRWSPTARVNQEWGSNLSQSLAQLKIYNHPWLPMLIGLAKLTFWDLPWSSWKQHYPLARYRGAISGIWLGLRQKTNFKPLSWSQYAAFRKEQRRAQIAELVEYLQ